MKKVSLLVVAILMSLAAIATAATCPKMGCVCKMEGVKREMANTANGVTITFTADKAETVKALQERLAKCPVGEMKGKGCCMAIEGVKREVKNTENGAIVTLTADKPETVKVLQEKAAACGKPMMGKGCAMHKGAMCGAKGCVCMMEGVKREVANTANGVTITLTAEKADVVKALQGQLAKCPMGAKMGKGCCAAMEGVKREVKNTENGAIVTMTSDKPETVKALQEKVAACGKEMGKGCPMHKMPPGCAKSCMHKGAGSGT